jgi:CBS-domain-containing membrane protein
MAHRIVRDVMTAEVVTVTEDAPFKELAGLMAERNVTALPVLGTQGRVVGIVAEVDLLRKEEYQDDPSARRLPRRHNRARRAQAAGLTARDVMTSPPATISPGASIVEAARALDRHRVRHLVVTDGDGWLLGIVAPRDLLKVYLRSDDEIRDEIVREVITDYLGTNPARAKVAVTNGVVTLGGEVEKKSMIRLAVKMARSVDGVVDVTDRLSYAIDDSRLPSASDLAGY